MVFSAYVQVNISNFMECKMTGIFSRNKIFPTFC